MIISTRKLNAQLSAYKAFYSKLGLEITDNSDFLAHELVERLIITQFESVENSENVQSLRS